MKKIKSKMLKYFSRHQIHNFVRFILKIFFFFFFSFFLLSFYTYMPIWCFAYVSARISSYLLSALQHRYFSIVKLEMDGFNIFVIIFFFLSCFISKLFTCRQQQQSTTTTTTKIWKEWYRTEENILSVYLNFAVSVSHNFSYFFFYS